MSERFILCTVFLMIAVSAVLAQIPQTMSYQGVLTDANGNAIQDGGHNFIFRIYEQESGGSPIWEEAQVAQTSGGLFEVVLGRVLPLNLPFDRPYFLGVSVDGGDEMSPRIPLTATPYSLNAQSVADGAVTAEKIAAGQVVKSVNNLKDDVTLAAGDNITISSSDNTITISAAGGGTGGDGHSLDAADGDPTDAVFVDNDGKVGVGTTTPDEKLSVTGMIGLSGTGFGAVGSPTIKLSNTTSTSGRAFGLNSANTGAFQIFDVTAGNLTRFLIDADGNVGIGTTSPSEKLDVNGQIRLSGELNRSSTGAANMVPIAYGNVASDGTINVGTGNFSVVWDSSNKRYRITITGESYFWKNYITIVTPMTGGITATTSSQGGDLLVEILDSTGAPVQGFFQFVTYKP